MIVRALDVGYGNVKFVLQHDEFKAPVICGLFPSLSATVQEDDNVGAGTLKKRKTVVVEINGTLYEVGPEVLHAQGANDVNTVFHKDFVKTDSYMARTIGALHYMFEAIEENHLDLLIVGLPVNNMSTHKSYLLNKLKGKHTLPGGREIEIKDVKVFEQPLGAFFNFIYSSTEKQKLEFEVVKNQNNLVIDPGMYTFDWLLIQKMTGNSSRSGATNRSMSDILKVIANYLAKKHNTNYSTAFNIVNDALNNNTPAKIFKTTYNIEDLLVQAKSVINESVEALYSTAGDGADIDNIILVGGGSRFFVDAIQAKYPHHTILTTDQSVYANVIGFQLAGERAMIKEQVMKRKQTIEV